jgi:hypothetical protein
MRKLEGASPDVPKFFGSARALPSRKTALNLLLSTMVKGKNKMW